MKFAPRPRFWFLAALATATVFIGLSVFHAEEDPNDNFVYDRTESVLHLSLSAPDGTSLSMGGPAVPVGVLLERYSWEIWRHPSSALEQYRDPNTVAETGATVSFTRSPEIGSLSDSTLTTDNEGRAWVMFSPGGGSGGVSFVATSGDSTATLVFDIRPPNYVENSSSETWSYSHTEATLVAEITSPQLSQDVPSGLTFPVSLSVRYETWDVEVSNFGNSRTENHTSAPAIGAGVNWTIESGDGSVSGYAMTDASGTAEGSITMGSGETAVRADVSYATGQATSATLAFLPPADAGAGASSDWWQIGSETIPAITNLMIEGTSDLYSGETRQFSGMVQGAVWDFWTDGINIDRRYNYTTPLPNTTVYAEASSGWVGSSTFTTDGSGWFSSGFTIDSGPAQLSLRLDGLTDPAAILHFGHMIWGGPGPRTDPIADYVFLRNEAGYAFESIVVDGPTYDLAPGDSRTISGSLIWMQWEVWGNPQGHTEARNARSSPAASTSLSAPISQGDGSLFPNIFTTGSMGEFSTTFTMGQENSNATLAVQNAPGTHTTIGFTRPNSGTNSIWTFNRKERTLSLTLEPDYGSQSVIAGSILPMRLQTIETSWEIWVDQHGVTKTINHATGPAIGANVLFAHSEGPGNLQQTNAVTDANGIAVVPFEMGSDVARISANVTFEGASASATLQVGPDPLTFARSESVLLLSLDTSGDPANTIVASTKQKTTKFWMNQRTGTELSLGETIAPAVNAIVTLAVTSGENVTFVENEIFTDLHGVAQTLYVSTDVATISATAEFADLTATSTLIAVAGSGDVRGPQPLRLSDYVDKGAVLPTHFPSQSPLPFGLGTTYSFSQPSFVNSNNNDGPIFHHTIESEISHIQQPPQTLEGSSFDVHDTQEFTGTDFFYEEFREIGAGLGDYDYVDGTYIYVGAGGGSYNKYPASIRIDGWPQSRSRGKFIVVYPSGAPETTTFQVSDGSTFQILEGESSTESVWYEPPSGENRTYAIINPDGGGPPSAFHVSASDAAGPRYRKIGLNGLPLPDEKPQVQDESGVAPEETYIDALTRDLRHSTSDIYVETPSSLLPLQVRRDAVQEVWNERSGLLPHERPDRPFGLGWTSNLCGAVKLIDGVRAEVTDEQGASQVFVWTSRWVHTREERIDAKSQFNTLRSLIGTNGKLVGFELVKKFGTTVRYEDAAIEQVYPSNRQEWSGSLTSLKYFRITSVTDRYGNKLLYDYNTDGQSLIPNVIRDPDRPGHRITIELENGRVSGVRSPGGATTSYSYENIGSLYPARHSNKPLFTLSEVHRPGSAPTRYGFDDAQEFSPPQNASIAPPEPVIFHFALGSITSPGGSTWSFSREFNHDFTYQTQDGLFIQTGQPRPLITVQHPPVSPNTPALSTVLTGAREIQINGSSVNSASAWTDVTGPGGSYSYDFSDPDIFYPTQQNPSPVPDNALRRHFTVSFKKLKITKPYTPQGVGDGNLSGQVYEEYTFSPAHGMALTKARDIHGHTTEFGYAPDGFDDPVTETDALGFTKHFAYETTTRVLREIIDERGFRTTYQIEPHTGLRLKESVFPPNKPAVKVTDWKYHPTRKGFAIEEVVSGEGAPPRKTTFEPDPRGRVLSTTVHGGSSRIEQRSIHDLDGRLRGTVDPRGNRTVFDYNDAGRLERVTNPDFTTRETTYFPDGKVDTSTDEAGTVTSYLYDGLGRRRETRVKMSSRPGPDGAIDPVADPDLVTTTTYTGMGLPDLVTDPRGTVTDHDYDTIGRLTKVTRAKGTDLEQSTTLLYQENSGGSMFKADNGKPTLVTGPRGETTVTIYDDLYRPVSVTESQRGKTTYVYDEGSGYAEKTIFRFTFDDQETVRTSTREYDAFGNVVKEIRPGPANVPESSRTYRTYYTASGAVWKTVDPLLRETTTIYDAAGFAREVRSPWLANGTRAVVYTDYDAAGNPVEVKDARGKITETVFDARNRPIQVIAPPILDYGSGQVVRPRTNTDYDDVGRVTSVTDPRGAVTSTYYDEAGRAYRQVDALAHEVLTWYDHGGLPLFVKDPRGFLTENRYDELGRLRFTIAPTMNGDTATTEFNYDASGNRTLVKDAKGNETVFTYDHGNRVLTQTFAGGDKIENTYDARNLRTRTDAFGTAEASTTIYTYDLEDRLKTVDPPGAGLRTYFYDGVGRLTDVTEADNPTATVSYAYDALDRVTKETSRGLANDHTYDLAGNPLTTTYSSGASVTRTYNDLGLINTLVDNANRTTTWHYDKTGRARALTLPNGQTQVNAYDDAGRLTGRVLKMAGGGVLAAFGWAHDAAGNVLTQSEVWTGTTDRPAGTRTTSMTYHDAGWLHTETITAPGEPLRFTEYLYDDAANRELKIVSENGVVTTSTAYDYNPANQLESWTERDGAGATLRSAVLGFDERGNRDTQTLTLAGGDQKTTGYEWDFQNRLVGVTDPQGGQHAYAYDYRTRRIARSEPIGATAVSWSGGLSLAEYPVTGLQGTVADPEDPTVEYRRGPDMGGGIGGLLHSLRDGVPKYNLGNGRGDVVAQSDATGALTWTASYEAFGTRPVETGNNADRQRANTKEEDPTGLLWEHFRYRDLETGVWLSRDPAGFVDGPNLYAYVRQNPWTAFDPLGLKYDTETFDDNGYIRTREGDDAESAKFNEKAQQFNDSWKQVRETDVGQELHEYLRDSEHTVTVESAREINNRAQVQSQGEGRESVLQLNLNSEDSITAYTAMEEMFHAGQNFAGIDYQNANPPAPGQLFADWDKGKIQAQGSFLKNAPVAMPGDSTLGTKDDGRMIPLSNEAQAMRAVNIMKLQAMRKHPNWGPGFVPQRGPVRPLLESLFVYSL
jgi:RHS repeat-associated protein